jgi:hypothetical protein
MFAPTKNFSDRRGFTTLSLTSRCLKSWVFFLTMVPTISTAALNEPIQVAQNEEAPTILKKLCDLEKKYEVQLQNDSHFVLKKHPWFPDWEIELLEESSNYYYGQNGYVFSRFWALDQDLYALTSGEFTPHGEFGETVSVFLNEQNCY